MTFLRSLFPNLEVHHSRIPAPVEPPRFRESYVVGVDLGQANDSTAIAVVRKFEEVGKKPVFHIGHLERLPLGTSYPNVVAHVVKLLSHPQIRGRCELALDFTGCGRPVANMFDGHGVNPIKVNITAGNAVTHQGGNVYGVPKQELVSRLQSLLHEERLHFSAALADLPAMLNELQNFQVQFTASGHMTFNARVGRHDDMVLALAIAVWRAYGNDAHAGIIEFYDRLARGDLRVQPPQPAQLQRIRLKRWGDASTVYTGSGECLNVSEDGTVAVLPEDAPPLLQAGWTHATQ